MAKCLSQVNATIKRTDPHIATCPNASIIPRTVLKESEDRTREMHLWRVLKLESGSNSYHF